MSNLLSILESLLFVSSRPLTTKELAKLIDGDDEAVIEQALLDLQAKRSQEGVVVLHSNNSWQLATHPTSTEIVRKFLQSDLKEKLTDASLEVLSVVAYKQPVSKAEIEAIRGVNSQYSLRLLLMRGLIEKTGESRASRYQVTAEFLQYLGVQSVYELPDFENISKQVRLPETPETRTGSLDNEFPASESPLITEANTTVE